MATIITTQTQLQDMQSNLSADYELGANIFCTGTFTPVGTFKGTFDGKGYKIYNLVVNRPADNNNGLFGSVEGGTIQNVGLIGGSITGKYYTGGLIGELDENVDAWPTVVPYTILNCYSTATIIGQLSTGGLIGQIKCAYEDCLIALCYATGDVTDIRSATCSAGGLIGNAFFTNSHLLVRQCFATGDVSAADASGDAGGLIGSPNAFYIRDCYARGNVLAGDDAGGLLSNLGGAYVDNCFSTGKPTGGDIGGLIGGTTAFPETVTNSFWDKTTSEIATSAGDEVGKTTAQMKSIVTFQAAGWVISRIWGMTVTCNNGYPCLIGVNPCCPISEQESVDQTVIGNKVSLEAIRNIEIVYGGRFYINKSGNAVYESRYHRNV